MWALIFITFLHLGGGAYSFEATKDPYLLGSLNECESLKSDIAAIQQTKPKWVATCVRVPDSTTPLT